MTTPPSDPLNLFDFERIAAERLPGAAYDYYASGAHDEVTLRENRAAFERLRLHYRVLAGVGERDTRTVILGRTHDWPVLLAPTAFARMAHPDGELAVARAAGQAGVTQVLSTLATTRLEDVAAEAARPPWFQLYVFRDRALTLDLVRRAEAAGYEALVLTVDAPLLGQRERDARNGFSLPPELAAENLPDAARGVTGSAGESGLFAYFRALIDPALDWHDLDWLCAATPLPVLVKGIVRADDAVRALDHGAAGVIVSNHGGRQLDTAPATIEVLPRITAALAGRAPVLMDGGVRRGTDIVKALAHGAAAVLIGRPVLWGLAAGGEAGVHTVLRLLRVELDLAMALCGAANLAALTPDLLDGGAGPERLDPDDLRA